MFTSLSDLTRTELRLREDVIGEKSDQFILMYNNIVGKSKDSVKRCGRISVLLRLEQSKKGFAGELLHRHSGPVFEALQTPKV